MTDTDIHKLTGAYATDAIDEVERARFEQHLATCEDCRAEVAELREAAARLAEITATTAPASLRSSVLAGISQVRPLPPVTPGATGGTHRAETPDAASTDTESHDPTGPTRLVPRSQRRGLRRWIPMAVAAVLALVAGVALSATQPWAEDDERRLTVAERVLQAPDAEEVVVDLGAAGEAKVVRSKSVDRAVIVTEDMAPAPEGRVYELWFQDPDDGGFVPAGLMADEEDQTMVLEGSAAEAVAVGITVEPDGGSDVPTTNPIALFDLSEAT